HRPGEGQVRRRAGQGTGKGPGRIMNTPPIFRLCAAAAGVKALLGTAPVRLFLFGEAPEGVQKPYAVWQVVGGSPENYLAGRPDAEQHSLRSEERRVGKKDETTSVRGR